MRTPVFVALVFALAVLGFSSAATCVTVEGHFVATAEIPCLASPVLLCTHGDLDGGLDGDYYFVMTSQAPLSDPADPALLAFTGTSLITVAEGTMDGQDTGRMWVNPAGPWPFETIVNVVGGTGAWAGTTGKIVATGALDTQAGVTEGDYVGTLCRA